MTTKKNTLTREGKLLRQLPAGDRRRMSDAKNAWRKMTPEQRRDFVNWMVAEGLPMADDEGGAS